MPPELLSPGTLQTQSSRRLLSGAFFPDIRWRPLPFQRAQSSLPTYHTTQAFPQICGG